jgi:ribosome-associated protein
MREELGPPLVLANGTPLPRRLLRMSAVTSPGPGGQHVYRSNTAVELRVPVDELPLSPDQLAQLRDRLAGRITRSGELRVEASDHRSQWRNRRTAEQRLIALIDGAIATVADRAPTRPSRAALARRRADRERAQAQRAQRRPPGFDE